MKIYQILVVLVLTIFIASCSNTSDSVKTEVSSGKTPTETAVAKKDLTDILANMAKYKADYDITSNGSVVKASLVYDLPRFAMSTKIAEGDVKMIFDGVSFITCTNMENEWSCFKMSSDKPETVKITEDLKSGASKTTIIGTCKRAGESGTVYEVESKDEKSTVCYTNDGIVLEMKNENAEMIATKVIRGVSDSDFTPPATPKDLNQMFPNGFKQ